jgi:hypothetical protein
VLNTVADLRDVLITADACAASAPTPTTCTPAGPTTCSPSRATSRRCAQPWPGCPEPRSPGCWNGTSAPGRIESRSIKVIDLSGTLEAALFPHGARAIKVVRRRRGRRHPRGSVERCTPSPPWATATPTHACWPARSARTGPSRTLHWVRDVTEGEDHSAIRTGSGPQVMAALRNTALNLIWLRGGTNIAAAHRAFSYRPADVLDALSAA